MDFPTFQKAIDSLKAWRAAKGEGFPDSRDPEFQTHLQVPSQDFEKAMVALYCWRENAQGLYPGMIAVGHVINNRAKKGWFSGNLYLNTITPQKDNEEYPEENDTEFIKTLTAIEDLFDNKLIDRTDGSLYFTKLAAFEPERPPLAQIGQTFFFT